MAKEADTTIENADLDLCKEEFRHWAHSVANQIDSIFSVNHLDYFEDPSKNFDFEAYVREINAEAEAEAEAEEQQPKPSLIDSQDIERLCAEFETVFEYAKHGEVRINDALVYLEEIEAVLGRFLALGGLTWARLSPYMEDSGARERGGHSRDQGLCVLIGKHAEARRNLDFGYFVNLPQIALLARIDERSVHNATLDKRPQSRLILEEFVFPKSAKYVSSRDALKWLEGRRKFKKTKTILGEIIGDSGEYEEPATLIQIQHFVPVASDATIFHQETCKSPDGYYSVGEKGKEEKFDSYFEALVELQRMPVPRWRRPNANGHFGIVRGVSWERQSAEDLGLENLATGAENLASLFEEE